MLSIFDFVESLYSKSQAVQ